MKNIINSFLSIFKKKTNNLFCPKPFEFVQIAASGELFICCPQMLMRPTGNLLEGDFMKIWNSDRAQEIRRSIFDGSFKFCNLDICADYQRGILPKINSVRDPYFREIIDQKIIDMVKGPSVMNLAYDESCNLACPSCRKERISLSDIEFKRRHEIHKKVFGPHINDVKRIFMSGYGDPFASKLFLNFLKNFDSGSAPQTRIQLSTNGLLFDQKMWGSICSHAIDCVDVSVDAATAETYKKNRGGNFEKLLKNLEFLGSLRRKEQVEFFSLQFVVQKNNYHEMKQFVQLGIDVGCDEICFKQLVDWSTFTQKEFRKRAVQFPEHPEHGQFLKSLEDPILKHPKINFFDLSHLVKQ